MNHTDVVADVHDHIIIGLRQADQTCGNGGEGGGGTEN